MGSSQAAFRSSRTSPEPPLGFGATASVQSASLYAVDDGSRAVLFDYFSGVIDSIIGEDTHLLVPWLRKPYISDTRTRSHIPLRPRHQGSPNS